MTLDAKKLEALKHSVGHRLKDRREGMGLPQAEVAHRMGVATSSVQHTEFGSLNPTIETLALHCDALGWKLGDLFTETAPVPEVSPLETMKVLLNFFSNVPADVLSDLAQADETDLASIRDILEAGKSVRDEAKRQPSIRSKKNAG